MNHPQPEIMDNLPFEEVSFFSNGFCAIHVTGSGNVTAIQVDSKAEQAQPTNLAVISKIGGMVHFGFGISATNGTYGINFPEKETLSAVEFVEELSRVNKKKFSICGKARIERYFGITPFSVLEAMTKDQ